MGDRQLLSPDTQKAYWQSDWDKSPLEEGGRYNSKGDDSKGTKA